MPLHSAQLKALLHAKQQDFQTFDQHTMEVWNALNQALQHVSQLSSSKLLQQLGDDPRRGARPMEHFQDGQGWVISSQLQWESRQHSLEWVRQQLAEVATFAVDGSQIYPSKDFSLPVALVQVGTFENQHRGTGAYHKTVHLELLTPSDLKSQHSGEPADRLVNLRRFQLETQHLITYLEQHAGCDRTLAFFDGALVATFANAFEPSLRDDYVQCLVKLLQASLRTQVPIVGYIDTTYARDLTTLLQQVQGLAHSEGVHDAQLLSPGMKWGDRTPIFQCQRGDILEYYGDQSDQIAFTYLKANRDYPVRLEFPAWVYSTGRYEQILNWVRAEVIVGGGYPYAIESADETAVLQASDRQLFYRILQEWAEAHGLHLRLSQKMISKTRRR